MIDLLTSFHFRTEPQLWYECTPLVANLRAVILSPLHYSKSAVEDDDHWKVTDTYI